MANVEEGTSVLVVGNANYEEAVGEAVRCISDSLRCLSSRLNTVAAVVLAGKEVSYSGAGTALGLDDLFAESEDKGGVNISGGGAIMAMTKSSPEFPTRMAYVLRGIVARAIELKASAALFLKGGRVHISYDMPYEEEHSDYLPWLFWHGLLEGAKQIAEHFGGSGESLPNGFSRVVPLEDGKSLEIKITYGLAFGLEELEAQVKMKFA